MNTSDSLRPESSELRKRRRWPWIVLVAGMLVAGLFWKMRSDAIEDRRRLRVWKAEAESAGFWCAQVGFGRPFGVQLGFLDAWMRDHYVAVSVRDDQAAARLMEIQAPPPSGLILVDEGLSSPVAAELQRRFPKASMPKITPPPMAAAPAAPSTNGSP